MPACTGTTHEPPHARFDHDERAQLQPLPARRYTSLVLNAPAIAGAAAVTPGRHRREAGAHGVRPSGGSAGMNTAPLSRRDRIPDILSDLRMPGALEALDVILRYVDGGTLTAPDANEQLLMAQIQLRNNRRVQAAMRSSRLPAVKQLRDFDFTFQPSRRGTRSRACTSSASLSAARM
jgi:hypothetical protein